LNFCISISGLHADVSIQGGLLIERVPSSILARRIITKATHDYQTNGAVPRYSRLRHFFVCKI